MCLTTGRSGTNLLETLLSTAEDTCAVHEPEPAFQHVLPEVKKDPAAAENFVENIKLPDILARPGNHYVETSHLFGKGFFEAFVNISIPFKLIILHRPPREVAKSYWRVKAVPGRTKRGNIYLFHPEQNDVIQLKNWQNFTDYQLCYWYTLEVERRKKLYIDICREKKIPYTEIHMHQLTDWGHFSALCRDCGIPLSKNAEEEHRRLSQTKVNRKAGHWPKIPFIPYSLQESGIWKAIGTEGEALKKEIQMRYLTGIHITPP